MKVKPIPLFENNRFGKALRLKEPLDVSLHIRTRHLDRRPGLHLSFRCRYRRLVFYAVPFRLLWCPALQLDLHPRRNPSLCPRIYIRSWLHQWKLFYLLKAMRLAVLHVVFLLQGMAFQGVMLQQPMGLPAFSLILPLCRHHGPMTTCRYPRRKLALLLMTQVSPEAR